MGKKFVSLQHVYGLVTVEKETVCRFRVFVSVCVCALRCRQALMCEHVVSPRIFFFRGGARPKLGLPLIFNGSHVTGPAR